MTARMNGSCCATAMKRWQPIALVFGAYIGIQTRLPIMSGGLGFLLFFAVAFGFIFAIEKTKTSAAGVPVLLGFTFFMGLMLSRLIAMVLGFKNGSELVMTAFGGTAGVFFVMASLATVIKRDLSGMGKFLFVGAIMLLVAGLLTLFSQSSALMITLSVIAIGLFSAFMLYDLKRVMDGGETNYVTATLSIYLSVYNVFSNLLAILGIVGGDRD